MATSSGRRAYGAGVGVALLTAFLIVWTSIVRDDGSAMGPFMAILAVGVGGFASRFRPEGMARTLLGVAVMQVLLGLAAATAPSTANLPGGPARVWLFCGAFTALWLISAACFRRAWTRERSAAAAP